jgi:crossover junction endodeoxyribonuclease RuvC
MRTLAIDPGYGRCGIAVLERSGSIDTLLYSSCMETSAESDFPDRIHAVIAECRRIANEFNPDCLALEKLFFAKNQKTALRVAEVRGALIALAGELAIPVFEYAPSEIKSAAAGYGGADKKQVIKMLHALVKIMKPIRLDDEYDAIAVGVAHFALQSSRSRAALLSRPEKR